MKYFTTHDTKESAKAMVLLLKTRTTKNIIAYEIKPRLDGMFDLFIKEAK